MQSKIYHILNGDALKDQWSEADFTNVYVARECLVDGDVQENDLEILFHNRARYLNEQYKACTLEEYYAGSVAEFQKIMDIPHSSEVNLWFEDDLFCQVNLWFVLYLLGQSEKRSLFLIRPPQHTKYGFGAFNRTELQGLESHKIELKDEKLAKLWPLYQQDDIMALADLATDLQPKYPFILTAVHAHIASIPSQTDLGRPKESLLKIMKDIGTEDFGAVFRAFCERESIYGYGDIMVKRLYEEVLMHLKDQ